MKQRITEKKRRIAENKGAYTEENGDKAKENKVNRARAALIEAKINGLKESRRD